MKKYLLRGIPSILLCVLLHLAAFSQEKKVSGTVKDEKGTLLPGATVLVKGLKVATSTDVNGNFSLNVPEGSKTLVISFVGMQSQEVQLGKKSTFDITLSLQSTALNDLVVIGYGTVKKSDLTGSVQKIGREDLIRNTPTNALEALQGKLAGVNVTQNDGAPGAGLSIRIRGSNSFLGGTEPLYVIDGVPFNNSSSGSTPASIGDDEKQTINAMSFVNPSDIESIEVLKDASATAIYGSRGANGVVLITTRRGRTGKDKVELNINVGMSEVSRRIKVLNAHDYALYQNESFQNENDIEGTTYDLPYPGKDMPVSGYPDSTYYAPGPNDYGTGTNWQDQIFRHALFQNYSISISGGSDAGNHSLSFNYLDQDGTILNSNFKRYSVNLNLNRNLGKYIKMGTSTMVSRSIMNGVKTGTTKIDDVSAGVVRSALTFPSTQGLIDPATGAFSSVYFITNPYVYTRDVLNKVSSINIFTSNYAEASITKDLKFRQNIGFNYAYNLRDQYYPRSVYEGQSVKGWGLKADDIWSSVVSESLLTYAKKLNKHSINVVAGGTYERTDGQTKNIQAKTFPNDLMKNENLYAGEIQVTPVNNRYSATLVSGLVRANYNYDDRYLLTASFRRDGSSKFGKDNKWANFPSFALGWKLVNESFIKSITAFSDLKLRASYGQTGNQGIGSYASLSKLAVYNYILGGSVQTGLADDYYSGPANNKLKWETTAAYNLGLDVGLFSRINLHVDVYKKKTDDLLQYIVTPSSTGFGKALRNSGSVENKGLEVAIDGTPVKTKQFEWNVSANIAFNRNKILSLGGDVTEQFADNISTGDAPFIQKVGHPIGALYGYKEDGYYDNEAEVRSDPAYSSQSDAIVKRTIGEIKYKDLDGTPGITTTDRTFIGNVNPKYTFGITNNFHYKNWDFSVFVSGVQGNDVINMNYRFFGNIGDYKNISQNMWDTRWQAGKDNSNAAWPKAIHQFWRTMYFSRRYIEDGSFVKIKNVNLGYNVPVKVIGVSALRVSLAVNNLYTFTKYTGYDPEVNGFGDNPALFGVDLGGYPGSRTYTFSVRANF
ncbi:TonB-linked outer membrane protein, SusC/RagA family [Chitinophaga sp. YR573]|uniref:SusC/RagA family TonB-linked outer membrane protein n=1 Tax=Chitinophaga sp. YR573 TaxID=1881040 RepID=UPI0008B17A40|nr:TonB-dependent receptor [Chitinophaga sp. YR573]SEW46830.1 TonB-linked outer membrane protein, SusC/RagA family [Chitinophaga sp. YR573]